MNAFITGSHAYGTPHDKSDVDLVVRIDADTGESLIKKLALSGAQPGYTADVLQFKLGALNLILCRTDSEYEVWKLGTEILTRQKPVTREQAVNLFKALRAIAKPTEVHTMVIAL